MKKLLILLFTIITASDQIPGPEQTHPILLSNGVIHSVINGTVHGPDLLFEN